MSNKYALFIGCTIPVRAMNYEISVRKVAEKMGIDLIDIEFECCGFPIKSVNREAFALTAAVNLAQAEKKGLDICTLCSACTGVLAEVNKEMKENVEFRGNINAKLKEIGFEYNGSVEVKHFARVLYENIGKIKGHIVKPLTNLKIAPHYGCHYLKPSYIHNLDNPEDPESLDKLIEITGAESVNYMNKKQCCGGGILSIDENIALTMSREKLDCIKNAGADGIALICPFCGIMYDANQRKINSVFGEDYDIPVLYYPQLLGLAMGFNADDLGFWMNRVKTDRLIEKIDRITKDD
ncbi:MAG: hypothetical protein A7316_05180 [Candidatus Altiarchaeales archaeon WOR_SM1_86-2]|nr:MAG: hypothetical protein A7316_05180 [Candidatus Altiarchaeales archaeon WOR_SM1_86-2]ODS41103.1 MAG: hypothetical protein A7315_06990 [Candidatus Altiarchaeales archaeon WOR_SM1_79]